MNEWKAGTNTHGRCSEVAVMGRLSISGFEKMIRKWGQKNKAVVQEWLLWGGCR